MKDIITGLFFISVGVFFLLNSLKYHTGTLAAMGPGFFPAVFSSLTILLGLIIGVKGFLRGRH